MLDDLACERGNLRGVIWIQPQYKIFSGAGGCTRIHIHSRVSDAKLISIALTVESFPVTTASRKSVLEVSRKIPGPHSSLHKRIPYVAFLCSRGSVQQA